MVTGLRLEFANGNKREMTGLRGSEAKRQFAYFLGRDDVKRIEYIVEPYDPAKLKIEHVRFSTTQGECRLTYDGYFLGQFGDNYTIQPGGDWRGFPDEVWHKHAPQIFNRG